MTTTRRISWGVATAMAVAAVAVLGAQQSGSPIADAARKADREAVRALLKQGADVSASHADGMTALHYAADRGDAAMVDMLIYAGANVSAVTRLGHYTPLHLAARNGSAGGAGAAQGRAQAATPTAVASPRSTWPPSQAVPTRSTRSSMPARTPTRARTKRVRRRSSLPRRPGRSRRSRRSSRAAPI